MRLFRDYLEELEHPVEQLADFPQREIDVATAKYLECQPPNGVFNIVSEAWLDYDPESDHGSLTKIAEMVRDGEIDKIKGYDMIFENLRSASEVQINDEINTFNEA